MKDMAKSTSSALKLSDHPCPQHHNHNNIYRNNDHQYDSLLQTVLDLANTIVRIYLEIIFQPSVQQTFHTIYNVVDSLIHAMDQSNIVEQFSHRILRPYFSTGTTTTILMDSFLYIKIMTVVPTILLVIRGQQLLPACVMLVVQVLGVHGTGSTDSKTNYSNVIPGPNREDCKNVEWSTAEMPSDSSVFPASSDSFEILTIGGDGESSPKVALSYVQEQRSKNAYDCINNMCHPLLLIPCWIVMLTTISDESHFVTTQYVTIMILIAINIIYTVHQLQSYFDSGTIHSSELYLNKDTDRGIMDDDLLLKMKHMYETVGKCCFLSSSLYIIRYIGLLFLLGLAVPVSYEITRRRLKLCIVFVTWRCCDGKSKNHKQNISIDYRTVQFLKQSSQLGSKLIVGIPSAATTINKRPSDDNNQIVKLLSHLPYIHTIVMDVPNTIDLIFIEQFRIDYVVIPVSDQSSKKHHTTNLVTAEVIRAKRVFVLVQQQIDDDRNDADDTITATTVPMKVNSKDE